MTSPITHHAYPRGKSLRHSDSSPGWTGPPAYTEAAAFTIRASHPGAGLNVIPMHPRSCQCEVCLSFADLPEKKVLVEVIRMSEVPRVSSSHPWLKIKDPYALTEKDRIRMARIQAGYEALDAKEEAA